MISLRELSLLIAQRAADLEKAREIFTAEVRAFVSGILAGVRRARSDPWTTSRVKIDIPREERRSDFIGVALAPAAKGGDVAT